MSVNNMIMAAAGVVTVAAGNWIAQITGTSTNYGHGIDVDSSGNVYVVGQSNSATAAAMFIAKFNSAGGLVWQRKLDVTSNLDVANGIVVDSAGNCYITGQANATTTANSYVVIAKYNTSGVIQWQRKIDVTSAIDMGSAIALDTSGNIYVAGSAGDTTGTPYGFVTTYDTNGVQLSMLKFTDSATTWVNFQGIVVDAANNIYLTGQAGAGYSSSTASARVVIVKLSSTGSITWQRILDASSAVDVGYSVSVDSSGNVFVTGSFNQAASGTNQALIAKYNSTGTIQWQRLLNTATATNTNQNQAYASSVDSSGNLYVVGGGDTTTTQYCFVAMYNTSGVIQWQRKFKRTGSADVGYGIKLDATGNMYILERDGTALVNILKFPADGTVPKTGSYIVNGSTYAYTTGIMTEGASTITESAGSLSVGLMNPNCWVTSLDTASQIDYGTGIAIDSTGNLYLTGGPRGTGTAAGFTAKYNSSGTIQWHRNLTLPSATNYGIAVDSSSNVYVVGSAGATTAGYVYVVKYNTSGVMQFQVYLDISLSMDTGYGIAVDTAGNFYITGQANATTTSNSYTFIAKYDTNGVNLWVRALNINGNVDAGYGIAVDGSGNVYVAGSTAAGAGTNDYAIIVKYNSSGVIQWQQKLDTASRVDAGYGIAVDSSGNVYVNGNGNSSTTIPYMFIAKYNSSGTIQWQRSLTHATDAVYGYGITVDYTGNVFVTGNNGTSALIVKYDTSGIIKWKTEFSATSTTTTGSGVVLDSAGYIYIAGTSGNPGGTASFAYITKLTADGKLYAGSVLMTSMITSTVVDAAGTLTAAASTLLSISPDAIWYTEALASKIYGMVGDSSGNIYIAGQGYGTTPYAIVAKYNTTGVFAWQRSIGVAGQLNTAYGIAVDGSGNVYVTGQANASTATASYAFVVKYDSTGAIQWQRSLDTSGSADIGYGVAVDSSGNVFVTGQANLSTATASYAFVVKYNSTGAFQWQQKLDTASQIDAGRSVAVDSTGNVYVGGIAQNQSFIAKYNTSGAIQWQRYVAVISAGTGNIGITSLFNSGGTIYYTGQIANTTSDSGLTAGSCSSTGTITSFGYQYQTGSLVAGYAVCQGPTYTYTAGSSNGSTGFICVFSGATVVGKFLLSTVTDIRGIVYDSTKQLLIVAGNSTNGSFISTINPAITDESSLNIIEPLSRSAASTSYQPNITPGTSTIPTGTASLSTGTATLDDIASTFSYQPATYSIPTGIATNYWFAKLKSGGADAGYGVAVDSSGNVYTVGWAGQSTVTTAKYNSLGVIQWQRSLSSASSPIGYSIAVDSSGNVFVGGKAGNAPQFSFIIKYNTSGVLQWQRALTITAPNTMGYTVCTDSSGNVYFAGAASYSGSTGYIFIAKYDTNGAIQWQRKLDDATSTTNDTTNGMAVDLSGNVYITGQLGESTSGKVFIAKYNTSGVIQWQRFLDITSQYDSGAAIAVDNIGNSYVTGVASGGSGTTSTSAYTFIAKYDTSGVIQWQVKIDIGSSYDIGTGIAVDSFGNIYVTGMTYGYTTTQYIVIWKLTSSGIKLWSAYYDTSGVADKSTGIAVDTTGDLYVSGQANGATATSYMFVMKLPADGTLLPYNSTLVGTNNTAAFNPVAGTLVDSAGAMTPTTVSLGLTDSAGTMTSTTAIFNLPEAAASMTDTAGAMTSSLLTL